MLQPAHQAFVAVDKRPRRLALLPANSGGEERPGSLPVQRLVVVQQLAEVRMRVRARPLRHVGEAEPHQAAHHGGGQMPEVSLSKGGGIPHPRHLQHPLGSEDGRRRGRLRPAERSATLGHYARHPGPQPEGHLQCRPPGRRRDIVRPPCRGVDLGTLHLRGPHQDARRLPHPALGAGVLVVEVVIPLPQVRGRGARTLQRHDGRHLVGSGPVHDTGKAHGGALHPRRVPRL